MVAEKIEPNNVKIVEMGRAMKLAKEREITLYINGLPSHLMATPMNLEELAMGFIVSEGLIRKEDWRKANIVVEGNSIHVDVDANSFVLELRSSGCVGVFREGEILPKVKAEESYSLDEARNALKVIEVEEYRETRGYHSAAIVGKEGMIARAIDVGRHNAVDKVIGMGLKKEVDLSKVFLVISGRISRGIAAKAARAGIPLVVSKASILDSAIDVARKCGLSIVSFASNIAIKGDALILTP
ncbi:MAG: formate dehydrogenase accessory sulfurtransferase FdhD [Archaeoglobus sp.]|nr:formate dehydrogenase accessory sulfurtransferase FdhD [Archaeoglobus sp.]